jgi:DNA-binding MarR family transcriptional regulator
MTQAFLAMFRALKGKLSYNNPLMHLPLVQMQAMQFIDEKGRATMKDVADFLSITPPSVTELVKNLADQKYLHRVADLSDRRVVHLRLTPTGTKILKKSLTEHAKRLKKILDKLTPKEQTLFLKLLSKMVNN